MALTVTHQFVSSKPEQADPSIIGPNEWNAPHIVTGLTQPLVFSDDYNFPCQTIGTALTANISNTITISPVPTGVNGSATQYYVYINDGSLSEAVLVTGGSAVSGNASGTLTFTPVHNHASTALVCSHSTGIREAANFLGGVGLVTLPNHPVSIKGAPLVLPTSISLKGQGFSANPSNIAGSIIQCDLGASPAIIIASPGGEASGQGVGIHADYYLMGPDSTTTTNIGIMLGGDPNGVFTPTSWFGSYTKFYNQTISNFGICVWHQRAYFNTWVSCQYGGNHRAFVFPSNALGLQPGEFYGTVLTVGSGAVIQMDTSNYATSYIMYFGGQISGTITGLDLCIESHGTHYEPNNWNDPILDGAASDFTIEGGICSVHGPSCPYMFHANNNHAVISISGCDIQCDSGTTVPYLIKMDSSVGGTLTIQDIVIQPAGTFTNVYGINQAAVPPVALFVGMAVYCLPIQVTAGSNVAFPISNFPGSSQFLVYGGTVGGGISSISGMHVGQWGVIRTSAVQTFNAGAGIGNSLTTVAYVPYNYYFDGTQLWLH